MKTTLRAKLLQHLAGKKKTDEGFTLIELLVVIIIIGILAAIALPSFLNQANKARQTEAATNIGAVNRGQQAYTLENSEFSKTLSGLGIGIRYQSDNYCFGGDQDGCTEVDETIGVNGATTIETAPSTDDADYEHGAIVYGAPNGNANLAKLKGYTGIAYLLSDSTTNEVTSTVMLFEANVANTGGAPGLSITARNNLPGDITSADGKAK